MKKSSILSLLIVFSVLISCAFHLSVCAEEAAPPEAASVPSAEELSAQPTIEVAPAQQAAEPASNPAPEPVPAPTSSPQPAANSISETGTAPAAIPTSEPVPAPVTTPSSETVAEPTTGSSTDPVTKPTAESTTAPSARPAPESHAEAKDAENNAEPVSSDSSTPDKSDGDVPAETERAASENSSSGNTVRKDTASEASDILPTDIDKNTSQYNTPAVETDEPDIGTGMHAAESGLHAAEDNAETYSITLRNRVYVDTEVDLAATFYLSILRSYIPDGLDLDWFKELFEEDGQYWTGSISLQNNEKRSLQGIPSVCPVLVNSIYPENDTYEDEDGDHEFSTSYIVGKTCEKDLSPVLNAGGDCTGDIEFTFLRFPEQSLKKLFVVNDSDVTGDDPLELELTVQVSKECVFDYSTGSGRTEKAITLNPGETIIKLISGEYGYISPKSGDLSDVKIIKTPANVYVTTGVSSVGSYNESSNVLTLDTEDSSEDTDPDDIPTAFALFRAEKPKTDTDKPKTDDKDDPERDSGNPTPGNDPGNPGTTSGSDPGSVPGKNTPVSNHTTSVPNKNKKSPDTDRPSADTSVSQKTPTAGTTSSQSDAVDTADRTPIAIYVLLMLAALVVIMIVAARSRQYDRRK